MFLVVGWCNIEIAIRKRGNQMNEQRYEVLKHVFSEGYKIYDTFLGRWVSDVLCCYKKAESICEKLNKEEK